METMRELSRSVVGETLKPFDIKCMEEKVMKENLIVTRVRKWAPIRCSSHLDQRRIW